MLSIISLRILFYESLVSELNKPNLKIHDSDTLKYFRKQILNFIRPRQNSTFKLHNTLEMKLFPRLRVSLSYLKELTFKSNFQDYVDPFCSYGNSVESNIHFFLLCAS